MEEFSAVAFFQIDKSGRRGIEVCACRRLEFPKEGQVFKITGLEGPDGGSFDPSLMRGTLMIEVPGKPPIVLHGVAESAHQGPLKDPMHQKGIWLGTYERRE